MTKSTRISFTREEIEWLIQAASEHAGQTGWDSTYIHTLKKLDNASQRVGNSKKDIDSVLEELVPEDLKQFLKERKVLDKYIGNIKNGNSRGSWEKCAEKSDIIGVFVWVDTPEGHQYWDNLRRTYNIQSVVEEKNY